MAPGRASSPPVLSRRIMLQSRSGRGAVLGAEGDDSIWHQMRDLLQGKPRQLLSLAPRRLRISDKPMNSLVRTKRPICAHVSTNPHAPRCHQAPPKTRVWLLEFAPASESREVDPLMGWTSSSMIRSRRCGCNSRYEGGSRSNMPASNGIDAQVQRSEQAQAESFAPGGYGENFATGPPRTHGHTRVIDIQNRPDTASDASRPVLERTFCPLPCGLCRLRKAVTYDGMPDDIVWTLARFPAGPCARLAINRLDA